ncbi:MAG: 16S rRNA (uracil(1498)-N(3))-methyltransferase [Bilophila sp.]
MHISEEQTLPTPPDWSDARTFFLPPQAWQEPYELDSTESHHLTRVLRIREGEDVRVLDGKGREGRFKVGAIKKNRVTLHHLEDWRYPEPAARVILAAGWTKAARRGWILEKAVEFEASGIWLWQAERSQFPVPSDIRESWQGQLIAGAKQCRNPWLPELRTVPGGVSELITLAAATQCEHKHVLVESGYKAVMSLTPETLGQPGLTLCVVGPEGGFTAHEVESLTKAGFLPATLGERVLRWESAAVLCLGLHWWKRQL